MATNYLVLGQVAPSATTATTLYTVPSSTQAVVSSIVVANRSTGQDTFRISVRPDGAAQANQHYLAYDTPLEGNDTVALTLGITLGDTDVLTVYSNAGNLSFAAFGSEIS